MKVLVTGGAGYIGSVLVKRLLNRGDQVTVLDKCIYSTDESLKAINDAPLVRADITDMNLSYIRDYDWCVHLAAVSNDPTAELSEDDTRRINVDGTRNVAIVCAENNVPMIFASTASVYGFREWELCNESTDTNPISVYAKSKTEAEQIVQQIAEAHDVYMPILRQATVFGWSPRMRYDLVVNAVIRNALTGKPVVVHGGGECWRPLVYVGDVVNSYLRIMGSGPQSGRRSPVINITHKNYRILELILWIKHVLETNHNIDMDTMIDRGNQPDGRSYALSNEVAQSVGIFCETGVSQCIGEIVANHNRPGENIDHPIHRNYDWLTLMQQVLANKWETIP